MSQPLVSVVTPSFNQSRFIKQTIDSVLQQDYPNIEYFVTDAQSTDGTLEILKSYTDPRITWISEPDKGQSDAINKGLRKASGEFYTYINSDDLLLPGAVSSIVRFFEAHPEVDALYGDSLLIDANGVETARTEQSKFIAEELFVHNLGVTQQGCFWRKQVCEQIGYFDERLHYTMDTEFWLRIALAGFNIVHTPGFWSAYRLHENAKVVSAPKKYWAEWDVMIASLLTKYPASPIVKDIQSKAKAPHDKVSLLLQLESDGQNDKKWMIEQAVPLARAAHLPYKERILATTLVLDNRFGTSLTKLIQSANRTTRKLMRQNA